MKSLLLAIGLGIFSYFSGRYENLFTLDGWVNSIYFTWCTYTTVGYGDVSPSTIIGKITMILGHGLFLYSGVGIIAEKAKKFSNKKIQIEKKYILSKMPDGFECPQKIWQAYIFSSKALELRLRSINETTFLLTLKYGEGIWRVEREWKLWKTSFIFFKFIYYISYVFYRSKPIIKNRYTTIVNDLKWKIDEYLSFPDKITAEVVLESEDQSIDSPNFISSCSPHDVTGDPRYSNKNLAINGFP